MELGLWLISLAQGQVFVPAQLYLHKLEINFWIQLRFLPILESSEFESMKRKKPMQETIERYGQSLVLECANEELCLFCFTSGISFLSLENPHFHKFTAF